MTKKKIALFGGSFNPPHNGHAGLISIVQDSFPCDEIWLMPSGDRKDKTMAVSKEDRLAMAHLLAEQVKRTAGPRIVVSTDELEQEEPTATFFTLQKFKDQHPDMEFYFVVTTETVPGIKSFWIEGEKLFNQENFVVVERPGFAKHHEIELPPHSVPITTNKTLPLLSSTMLRGITSFDELRHFTSEKIAAYIVENKLYSFAQKVDFLQK